ncbi:hypothetical protein BLA29_011929, partial [Euroglyphus maynei]
MKFSLILLIISSGCLAKTFGQTTIDPETILTDEISAETVTIVPENIVNEGETIPNEVPFTPTIVRNTEETEQVPRQYEQATNSQQQHHHQQQPQQPPHYQLQPQSQHQFS